LTAFAAPQLTQLTGIRYVNVHRALVHAQRRLARGKPLAVAVPARQTWKLRVSSGPLCCLVCGWQVQTDLFRWIEGSRDWRVVRTRLGGCAECGSPVVARQQLRTGKGLGQ
jgi:hypothetical protein